MLTAIVAADRRIRPAVLETPVSAWPQAADRVGGAVWVKEEHAQHTGSFKVRGATNAVLLAAPRGQPIVTASSGNHGIAVATALGAAGQRGTVYLPETVAPAKLAAVQRLGAEVVLHGIDSNDTEREAQRVAVERGWHYLSPYNDPDVVAGQGTIGLELARQLPSVDVVYVSVGGGGLIAGIAVALKAYRPAIRIVGCSPANSCVMHASVAAGRVLTMASQPTFSDGTAGGVDLDTITFDYCQRLADDWLVVSETEIARSMVEYIDDCHVLVEGSAGVAFAAMMAHAAADASLAGCTRAVISCGRNIGSARLQEVLAAAR
jgi:threonine dehydratase